MRRRLRKPVEREVRLDLVSMALAGLFDFIEDLQFWIKDRDGRYLRVNRGFLMNYSLEVPEQAIGKTDYDLSPQRLADQYRFDDEQVLAGHSIINRMELVGRFDHTACWCVTTKIPLRDESRRIIGTTGITRSVKEASPEESAAALGKVIAYMREHFAEPITNETLARLAGLSERVFERRFKSNFHLSPRQYIKQLRVRLACHALVYRDYPLAQIASEHGFCDQSHFTREFSRHMGETPRHYRERYGAKRG